MQQSQRAEVQVSTRVDPKLVMTSTILQMNQQELEQAVEAELNDNPALERIEEEAPALDDEAITEALLGRGSATYRFTPDEVSISRPFDPDDSLDWTEMVAAPVSLAEHLRAQLYPMLPKHLHGLASDIADSVNPRGYLEMPAEEIALAFDATLDDVEAVVERLQQCEPAGVGARDLRECLLVQLRQAVPGTSRELATRMIRDGWEEFTKHRFQKLGRRFKATPEKVEAAILLVSGLTPFPGEAFRPEWEANLRSTPCGVVPDVVIRRSPTGYDIELRGLDPTVLSVSGYYSNLYDRRTRLHTDERKHVTQYVERANSFIGCILQRRRTIKAIVEHLLATQQGFIVTGSYRFLKPLTRMQLARAIGVHESTVSRATMSKFVQLPSEEVVSFDVFFKPALRVQKAIEEILQHENPAHPLSDERISQMLKQQGIAAARRTINKYREQLRILSSRRRRA